MIVSAADRLEFVQEYYFSTKLRQIAALRTSGVDIINIGIGSPDLPPSSTTLKALGASAEDPTHHGYQSYRGVAVLRSAIAAWCERVFHVTLDPESEILPLNGSKEGIVHIAMAFLNAGDQVLIPNPGYPAYAAGSLLADAEIVSYDLTEANGWELDLEKLRQADLSQVKLLWCNYPHMPTGTRGNRKLFDGLIRLAHEFRFLICNDNPYSLILNDSPASILACDGASDVALELNSLSKSHNMAGWRLGWVAGGADYLTTVLQFKSNMDSGMFLPLQHAAVAALSNSDAWHAEQNAIYEGRRVLAFRFLDRLGCTYDRNQVGLFVWARIPETFDNAENFVEDLLERTHVFVAPGFIFGSNGGRYIRIALCSSIVVFQKAIERLS